jgi:hypothetical protein
VHRADDDGDAWILQQYWQLERKGLAACILDVFTEIRCWVRMHGLQAVTADMQRINKPTSCWENKQCVLTVQYRFACIKLEAAKGFVAVVQVQFLMQQLAPLVRHQYSLATAIKQKVV